MKVMVIVKATKSSEAGEMPSTELLTAMGQYNEELVKAGIMLDGAGLKPSSEGARVRFSGSDRTVIDGPFAETKELIAGFWMWRVKSLQEAIDWLKKCPNPMKEDSEIEIRPLWETGDFGEAMTPELREQEAGMRAVGLGLSRPLFQIGPELHIVGLSQNYDSETRVKIPQQWEQFVPLAANVPGHQGTDFYGVCWNTQGGGSFDYLTGIATSNTSEPPEGMTSITLESRRYVVFPHTGHVSAISQLIETVWCRWVPDCGLEIAKAAPVFERYTAEFNSRTGLGGMELWIPLES